MNKPILDLLFPDSHNLKLLAIVDISYYPPNFNIRHPNIEITPPNFDRIQLKFSVGAMNVFNSNTLKLTCSEPCGLIDLPDGIWSVKYTIPPVADYYVNKTFIRVDLLKKKWEEAFLCVQLTECDEEMKYLDMKKLDEIWYYIQGAISNANKCNNMLAMKLYTLADGLLNKFFDSKDKRNV